MTRQLARPIALAGGLPHRTEQQATNRSWYRIKDAASVDRAEIHIYNDIGTYGIDANTFVNDLQNVAAGSIDVRLNSHGGEVSDGIAIYNSLLSHSAHVTIHVDGIAASIASVIMQAGDVVKVARNARVMIHDAMTGFMGNAGEMRKIADLLDMVSNDIADVYAQRAGGTVAQWRDLMRAETWYSAQEAVDIGLADEVSGRARDAAASGEAAHPAPPAAQSGNGREVASVSATRASLPPVPQALDPWATLVAGLLKPEEASK